MDGAIIARILSAIVSCVMFFGTAKAGSFSSGAAGGATAGALAGALNSGAGSTGSANAAGGGSTPSAPIEVNMMVYEGMTRLAKSIASSAAYQLHANSPVLLEDPSSSTQIALYQSALQYYSALRSMHDDIELSFSLSPSFLDPVDFTSLKQQSIHLTNITSQTLYLANVQTDNPTAFTISGPPRGTALAPGDQWTLTVTLDPNHLPTVSKSTEIHASLTVTVKNKETDKNHTAKIVPLMVTVGPKPAPPPPNPANNSKYLDKFYAIAPSTEILDNLAAGTAAGAGQGSGAGTGSGSQSGPQWISNFSNLGGAIEAMKSSMSYSSSSIQPTTQTFQLLLENELKAKSFDPYTSTSTLNVDKAAAKLNRMIAKMLVYTSDVNNWTSSCKPSASSPSSAGTTSKILPECTYSDISGNLAAAQQLITGFTGLIQNANDGNGNMVLVDILHGAALYEAFGCPTTDDSSKATTASDGSPRATCDDEKKVKIPSIQVSVVAAGGSTRVNAYFLVNIFYLPTPSYNAGAIVSFEIRDEDNKLLTGGLRSAYYDYSKKWQGDDFPNQDNHDRNRKAAAWGCDPTDTFCVPRLQRTPRVDSTQEGGDVPSGK